MPLFCIYIKEFLITQLKSCCRYFEELDPSVIRLQQMLSSGSLSRDHIFYKLVDNALAFAASDGNKNKHFDFKWDPVIVSFCKTIQFHGGLKVLNLLRGPGQSGSDAAGNKPFCWDDYNVPLPAHNTRNEVSTGYSTKSGILKPLLHSCLEFARKNKLVEPLVENDSLIVYPFSLAMDGMAITPGLVFDARQGQLLGTNHNINLDYVKQNPNPDIECLKKTFITEVESVILTSLDGKVSLPVGMNFTTKGVSGQDMAKKVIDHKSIVETCLNCLSSCEIQENVITETCCSNQEQTSDLTLIEPCQKCSVLGLQCTRIQVVVFASDCEEKNKKAMEIMDEKHNILPVPEAVHTTKRLRGSFGNWWLVCQDSRINMSMLRTIRLQDDSLKQLIPLDAVRQKDRMDVDSCLKISQPSVRRILQKHDTVSQVIVPEKYRLWDSNRPGVMKQPISIAPVDISQFMVLDAVGKLFLMRLHYPADLVLVDDTLRCPLSVVYLSNGLTLVSEPKMKQLSAIDLSGNNILHPETMTVAQLKTEVQKRDKSLKMRSNRKADLLKAFGDLMKKSRQTIAKPNYVGKGRYRKYDVQLKSDVTVAIMCIDPASAARIVVSDAVSHDILVLDIECNGLQIQAQIMSTHKGFHSHISSLCCNEKYIYSVQEGLDGGLLRIGKESSVRSVIQPNEKKHELLSVACIDTSIAVGDGKTGAILLYDENSESTRTIRAKTKKASDGLETSFEQPLALCFNFKNSLIVCDTAVGEVKVLSLNTDGLVDYLELLYLLNHTFGVHLPTEDKQQLEIDEAIKNLQRVVDLLDRIVANAREGSNSKKRITQGPDGTPATKTVKSVHMILSGVRKLHDFFTSINPTYPLELSSVLTLVCEHLFSTLRSKNPMPDMLEVSHLFAKVLSENMKKLSNCGFLYFTHRQSYYAVPNDHLSIASLESLECPKSKRLTPQEKKLMRSWRREHGQKVKQVTTRNLSTKDKPGTLPLNFYVNYKQQQPAPVKSSDLMPEQVVGELMPEQVVGNEEFLAVQLSDPGCFAIVVISEELQRSNTTRGSSRGLLYMPTLSSLVFKFSEEIQFDNENVLLSFESSNVNIQSDNLTLTEEIYKVISTTCSDDGGMTILSEVEDEESSEDECQVQPIVYSTQTRAGRRVKFNRNFNDFIA